MASKKFILLVAVLFVFFQGVSYSQSNTDWGWSWKDSSKVPAARTSQYNQFVNNQYPYPARPSDMWELGFSLGPSFVLGDSKPDLGIAGGVSLRKSISSIFSLRAGYFGSYNRGSQASGWTNSVDFKSLTHMLSLDVIASLNSLSYFRGNPKTNFYVLAGYDLVATQVKVKGSDGEYHVIHDEDNKNLITTFGGKDVDNHRSWALFHGISYGAGVAFKITDRVNIGIEERLTMPLLHNDYLDGVAYGSSRDQYSYTTARVNINLGNSKKKVQPLWWLNPNNYIYNELNVPEHMKIILPDADGDGVPDQFDLEPNTPKGAKVDSHGVALDTDGDGVPDYRDKELLTPQKCFPVNEDGVGTCPEPACCKELRDMLAPKACTMDDLPSIHFNSGYKLSSEAESLLAGAADKIKAAPNCRVKVIGHPAASKLSQQLSWERVNAVIRYLVEKQGIAENRFIFTYDGGTGDSNTIDLQGTTEEGPNTVPAPHPNLRLKAKR